MRALEGIGPPASNAVPLLTAILSDPAVNRRTVVAQVFAAIGPPARSAAPVIGAVIAEQDPSAHWGLLEALARVGGTPDTAVPALRLKFESGKPVEKMYAALALWHYNPQDTEIQDYIKSFLLASVGKHETEGLSDARLLVGMLMSTLELYGTNAAIFAPAMEQVACSGDRMWSNRAKRTLSKLQPVACDAPQVSHGTD